MQRPETKVWLNFVTLRVRKSWTRRKKLVLQIHLCLLSLWLTDPVSVSTLNYWKKMYCLYHNNFCMKSENTNRNFFFYLGWNLVKWKTFWFLVWIHKNEHGTKLEQRPRGSGVSSLAGRGKFGLGRELSGKGGGGRRKYGKREKGMKTLQERSWIWKVSRAGGWRFLSLK